MKRTQAAKLNEVLAVGSFSKKGNSIQFTPTVTAHEEYDLEPISRQTSNPFELVDHIYFDYLQKPRRLKNQ